jgi:hypothetical protein
MNRAEIEVGGAPIVSYLIEDEIYVSLYAASTTLGLQPSSQVRRANEHPAIQTRKGLNEKGVETTLLDLESFMIWLMSMQVHRIKSDGTRDVVIAWMKESGTALKSYWLDGMALNPNATDAQKEAAAEKFDAWFSARRLGIDTRKEFVSMVSAIGLGNKYPDAYQRSTNDLYTRLFNVTQAMRHEAVEALVVEKGYKTYVDPEGKRRSYNFRDTLTAKELSMLEDAERRIETAATALHNEGLDPDQAYGKARDQVLAKMGVTTPF